MIRALESRQKMKGFTLIELLVVVAIIALLISILLPSLSRAKEQAKEVKCGTQLKQIGLALQMCEDENKGKVPTHDDGNVVTSPYVMLTWVDMLYQKDYLQNIDITICPSDRAPDLAAKTRGTDWGFNRIMKFGVDEQPVPGVRTSFAINMVYQYGYPKDRWRDSARQVAAMDGWWTWHGNMSAYWLLAQRFGGSSDYWTPNWESNMSGYRHGSGYSAEILFRDQHVEGMKPRTPKSLRDWRDHGTFDTTKAFTWRPGELSYRLDNSAYRGEVTEWRGEYPELVDPTTHTWRTTVDKPETIDLNVRSTNKQWTKLPNPADRH